jgi:ferredoxin
MSGPALKPLALRCVFDLAREVDLPVVGVGGIASAVDAIEFLMVGASAVGVCTAAILRGSEIYGRIARGISDWLDARGYASIDDVRDLAIQRWRSRQGRTDHVPPRLSVSTCTGCGRCETSCPYRAIRVVEGKALLDRDRCYGCGLCVTRCPVMALEMD